MIVEKGNGVEEGRHFQIDCDMSGIPWYHCLTWWFRAFYPFFVRALDKDGNEISYKRFKTWWHANKYLETL